MIAAAVSVLSDIYTYGHFTCWAGQTCALRPTIANFEGPVDATDHLNYFTV